MTDKTKKKKKKEKKELNPIIESKGQKYIIDEELDSEILISSDVTPFKSEDEDSFYKHVVKELNNTNNISTKTEYLSINENFTGTKLEFLSEYANMPFLKQFVKIFETKRVSLQRKGRIELIKAIQEKDRELDRERLKNLSSTFGFN